MPKNSTTAANWKKAKRHQITLPSGVEVEVEIPNLSLLVKTGQLPNELVSEALGAMASGQVTKEIIEQQAEFYNKIVAVTVKDPVVTEEDVADLPFEDVEMIAAIATRNTDLDALGHHVGGLTANKEWRNFRGLGSLDPDVEGPFGGR